MDNVGVESAKWTEQGEVEEGAVADRERGGERGGEGVKEREGEREGGE